MDDLINMQKMMKQVQKMQADMARVQDELAEMTVTGTAGGGVVKVTANGQQEVKSIEFDPSVVNPEDLDMLEDLIVAAVNEALRNSQNLASQEMAKITGGVNIPGMPKIPGM
jgi:DNA-binding YbaB/EbfC family protein